LLKKIILVTAMTSLILGAFLPSIATITADEERVIRIIYDETDSASITLGSETEPFPSEGHPFTVNVILKGLTNYLFKYQVSVAFDKNKVECTGAWITLNDPNFVFCGEKGSIMTTIAVYNNLGFAAVGSMLPFDYVVPDHELPHYVNVSGGLLGQFNFTAINIGTSALEIILTESIDYPYDTFLLDKDKQNINFVGKNFSLTVLGSTIVPVNVDINPRTLNLKSKGRWITSYIELPEDEVSNINASTLLLNGSVAAESHPMNIGDEDGILDLMVKFNRSEIISYITSEINMTKLVEDKFMTINLVITGELDNGTLFAGSDTITILYMLKNVGFGKFLMGR